MRTYLIFVLLLVNSGASAICYRHVTAKPLNLSLGFTPHHVAETRDEQIRILEGKQNGNFLTTSLHRPTIDFLMKNLVQVLVTGQRPVWDGDAHFKQYSLRHMALADQPGIRRIIEAELEELKKLLTSPTFDRQSLVVSATIHAMLFSSIRSFEYWREPGTYQNLNNRPQNVTDFQIKTWDTTRDFEALLESPGVTRPQLIQFIGDRIPLNSLLQNNLTRVPSAFSYSTEDLNSHWYLSRSVLGVTFGLTPGDGTFYGFNPFQYLLHDDAHARGQTKTLEWDGTPVVGLLFNRALTQHLDSIQNVIDWAAENFVLHIIGHERNLPLSRALDWARGQQVAGAYGQIIAGNPAELAEEIQWAAQRSYPEILGDKSVRLAALESAARRLQSAFLSWPCLRLVDPKHP